VAYNALCGGRTLDDIEERRTDQVFLDGIGAAALPDPTAGDFCRRFDALSVMALQDEDVPFFVELRRWPHLVKLPADRSPAG